MEPSFWRNGRYTDRRPTFTFTHLFYLEDWRWEAKKKVTGRLAIKQLGLRTPKSEKERNAKKNQKYCKEIFIEMFTDILPKHGQDTNTL